MRGTRKYGLRQLWTGRVLLMAVMALLLSTATCIGEHPTEHPAEKPTSSSKKSITKEALAKAIEDYVKEDSELKGGYFLFYDKKVKKPLALELDKVHKARLAKVGDGVYFACADFEDIGGDMYDLDIFMEQTSDSEEALEVTEITLHKKDGKARYTWSEKNGIWKRKEK